MVRGFKRQSRLEHDGSLYALTVYNDNSALVGEKDIATGEIVFMRALDPCEDGLDMALAGKPRMWFESELKAGRAPT